jgi:phage terminase Nu1 subunit (DNA packaging protein)
MQTYSVNRCAEMLERDRATLIRALKNTPRDAGTAARPQYKIATAAKAVAEHIDGGGNGGVVGLATERAALAREQTAAVQIRNAAARGDLVSLTLLGKRIEAMLSVFRERVLSIPGKMADPLAMRPREEIEPLLRAELYEALAELSNPAAGETAEA